MRTIRKYYKTLQGFYNAAKEVESGCISLYKILDDNCIKYALRKEHGLVKTVYILAPTARKELATLIARLWTKSYHKEVENKVIRNYSDNSFLQHFYLEKNGGRFFIGNSLSGANYDYCRRQWLKS